MRLFYAVAFPDPVRERLAALVRDLSARVPAAPVKWEEPANLHLTLRFLGEVEDALLARVREAGAAVAENAAPFELALEKVSTFGSRRSPRVLWVGVRHDAGHEALARLALELERAAVRLGFPPEERAYAAHATIGRVRDQKPARGRGRRPARDEGPDLGPLVAALEAARDFDGGSVPVARLVLYESVSRGPRPPEYVEVASFPFPPSSAAPPKE